MGHPGGEVIDLIEGFRQAGLEFVLTKHETSAAFMAEAMATLTGVPGACVATLGPGATNIVTGVAHAFLDRAPVIVLTGQLPVERYEIVTHQKLDLRALFAPITKWQARVTPATAATVTDRALRVSLSQRRGPVFLEVPSDVAGQDAPEPPVHEIFPEPRGSIDEVRARRAADMLRDAKRPVILVGLEALDASDALVRLAEAWSIPVIASPKAKGVIRDDHPLYLGTLEGLGSARLYDWIDGRDLVLMVGFDPVEFDRDWSASAPVIHIGPLPNDDRYYPSALDLAGPVRQYLDALLGNAGIAEPTAAEIASEMAAFHDSFRAFVRPRRNGLTAQQVLAELRTALPEKALVSCDVGFNKGVASQCWPAYAPRTFFLSNGLSSMGYGLPAAIGLKLALPDLPVACILGDGGFAMSMAELETAARLGLALTVVVLADEALSQIRAGQERKRIPTTGTTFGTLDYIALARAFGARGVDVTTVDECRRAFAEAGGATGITLVAAHIDASGYDLAT